MYIRGLLPRSICPLDPPPEEDKNVVYTSSTFSAISTSSAISIFSDGSGGVHTTYPNFMRCGWGVAMFGDRIDSAESVHRSMFGQLLGSI
jgi:hypothetical protein